MTQKYCGHCGTPLAENALFCSACGTRRGAGAPSQQPPTPMAPPQPAGTQYAQPLSPSPTSGMPYVVPGTAASSIPGERRGGRKGVLLAGMVGLFLLAAGIAVVVLAFGKPPESLPSGDRKTPTPGISESRPTETTAASHVSQDFLKTDATLEDIVGTLARRNAVHQKWRDLIGFLRISSRTIFPKSLTKFFPGRQQWNLLSKKMAAGTSTLILKWGCTSAVPTSKTICRHRIICC